MNSPTTSWTLPTGPGLHFAYVLVSNGRGGYTERRIGVNTDTIGVPLQTSDEGHLQAPSGPAQTGDYYRSRADPSNATNAVGLDAYLPNLSVVLTDQKGLPYPSVLTDQKGEFVIAGVPGLGDGGFSQTSFYDVSLTCQLFGMTDSSCAGDRMLADATSDYFAINPNLNVVVGTFTLADGSPCGTYNEFFGVHASATATLLDSNGHILTGSVSANEFGDYVLPPDPMGATVSLACEGAQPVSVPFRGGNVSPLKTAVVAGVTPPTVMDMTASLNGQALAAPVAVFLPPPTGLPSDVAPRPDIYLAEKGLDSRLGACKYGSSGESVGQDSRNRCSLRRVESKERC